MHLPNQEAYAEDCMKGSGAGCSKLGICVIGLGFGAVGHAKHLSAMEDVDLYVCDTDRAKVESAEREFDVAGSFSSIDEALGCEAIDAVVIALPHHLHCPVTIKAAEAGKHCMVEKPMALDLQEADAMIEAAERAGTRLAVAENYHFMPDSAEACRLIAAGLVGTVFMVQVHAMWRRAPRPGSWWSQRTATGGGVLMGGGTHLIRTLRLLAGGSAELVFVLLADKVDAELALEGEDTAVVSVRFDNGIVGSVAMSWGVAHGAPCPVFTVYGTHGSIIATASSNRDDRGLIVHSSRIEGVGPADGELRIECDGGYRDSLPAECREFVRWLRTGGPSPIDACEGRRDLEIVEAAYRSAESSQAVHLPL